MNYNNKILFTKGKDMGDINVFSGPMKCGKSMHIMNEYNRSKIAGKNAMIFKPKLDDRAGDNIVSTRDRKINGCK